MQPDMPQRHSSPIRMNDPSLSHNFSVADSSSPLSSGRTVALTWFYDFSVAVPHLYLCREPVTREYLQHTKSRNFIVDINRGDVKGLKNEADRTIRAIRAAGLMNTGRGFAGCRIDALYNTCSVNGCTGFHARRCGALDLRNGTVQGLAREVCERLVLHEKLNPKMFYPAWKELSEEPDLEQTNGLLVNRNTRSNSARRDLEHARIMPSNHHNQLVHASMSWPPAFTNEKSFGNSDEHAVIKEVSRMRSTSTSTELEVAEAALLWPYADHSIVASNFSLFVVQPDEVVDPMRVQAKEYRQRATSHGDLNCGFEANRFMEAFATGSYANDRSVRSL